MTRPLPSLIALAFALPLSGCTLLWCFNNDPAGLPCDFTSSQEGACLEGYTCIQQANQEFVCVAQGALQVGEECVSSDQCGEDLTCDTLYGVLCSEGGADDPICSLIDDNEKKLACRQICDIANPNTCPNDTFCVNAEPDYCQAGVCATDSDCELVAGAGALCSGEGLNEGRSGLCFEFCNPLLCDAQSGVCPDCTGVDGAVDVDKTCVPVPDEFNVSTRNICDFAGDIAPFEDCAAGRCQAGSFCGQLAVGGGLVCIPWCNFGGGAPACPTNSVCTEVAGTLGVCQR